MFLGSKDKLIPVSIAESFRDKMTKQGIQNQLHVYEGEPHGFFNQGKKSFSDTLVKTDKFLAKLEYLSGPVDEAKIKSLSKKQTKEPKKSPDQSKTRSAAPSGRAMAQEVKGGLSVASPFTDNAVLQLSLIHI